LRPIDRGAADPLQARGPVADSKRAGFPHHRGGEVSDTSVRVLLLLHDGELADVRALAESAGAEVVECRPANAPADWDVLVTTGRYARSDNLKGGREQSVRIAVLDRNTRALRNVVRRAGIDLVVRRPVHPTALRLLLLHALYRGPERRTRRVAVGAAVRYRSGLLRKDGVLADLSLRGCQILSRHKVRTGHSVVVWVPDTGHEGKTFAVRGKVVRTLTTDAGERGFGVDFGKVAKDVATLLRVSVQAYLEGPAAIPVPGPDPNATQPITEMMAAAARINEQASVSPDPNETTGSGYSMSRQRREIVRAPVEFAIGAAAPPADADDRRTALRREYAGRRVVALGEEAARVLIGRDLSVGGMRIERAPNLAVGQRFRIAIHVSPGQTPLVVSAEILRDDGMRGFAVRFLDVEESAARYLAKMVDSLPVLAGGEGVVVSEIVPSEA
jgi:hypothetical protein